MNQSDTACVLRTKSDKMTIRWANLYFYYFYILLKPFFNVTIFFINCSDITVNLPVHSKNTNFICFCYNSSSFLLLRLLNRPHLVHVYLGIFSLSFSFILHSFLPCSNLSRSLFLNDLIYTMVIHYDINIYVHLYIMLYYSLPIVVVLKVFSCSTVVTP